MGHTYTVEKNYPEALKYVNRLIKINPKDAHSMWLRAGIYRSMPDLPKSLADMNVVLKLEPHNPLYLVDRATTYLHLRKFTLANRDIDEAILLDPGYATAYYIRSHLRLNEGLRGRAIQDATRAIELEGFKNGGFYFFRGCLYEGAKQYDKAISDGLKADELTPNQSHIKVLIGRVYHRLLEPDKALRYLNEAIKLNPTDASIYMERSGVHHTLMNWEEAVADESKVIQYSKDPPINALINRIRYYRSKKKFDLAIADQNKIMAYMPGKDGLFRNRSLIYEEKGDYEKAKQDINRFLKAFPRTEDALSSRARLNLHLKLYSDALRDVTEAIVIVPTLSSSYELRASIYDAMGKAKEAARDRATAKEIDRSNLPPR
ncbi:MAG: tetratricopeptide repeat protein [Leptolyngbya sp.]|nr:tetratricopeptide repeat protein [Candidatus Melainabacteria bacterium]